MKHNTRLESPWKQATWRAQTTAGRPSRFLVVASVFAIWCASFFAPVPQARAGDDNPTVSIVPRAPARTSQLKSRAESLRVDVNLVLIPVMVTDPWERPVQGLQKSDFHVFEDGVEQQISQFFSEEEPISVGIVFDASASMRKKLAESRQAILQFLKLSTAGVHLPLYHRYEEHRRQPAVHTGRGLDFLIRCHLPGR
jgi:hypothetical protein